MTVPDLGLIIFFALFACFGLLACSTKDLQTLLYMCLIAPVFGILFLYISVVVSNFILN